jgi:hypothetical protein
MCAPIRPHNRQGAAHRPVRKNKWGCAPIRLYVRHQPKKQGVPPPGSSTTTSGVTAYTHVTRGLHAVEHIARNRNRNTHLRSAAVSRMREQHLAAFGVTHSQRGGVGATMYCGRAAGRGTKSAVCRAEHQNISSACPLSELDAGLPVMLCWRGTSAGSRSSLPSCSKLQ